MSRNEWRTDLAEAAWWLVWAFVSVAGAIRQVRDGGTWIPAGSIVVALLAYSNFQRVAARLRAQRVRILTEPNSDPVMSARPGGGGG